MISLQDIQKKYEKIVVWGAGGSFKDNFSGAIRVDYIVDSDRKKWGQTVNGDIKIESPKKLLMENPQKTAIVICSNYWQEIVTSIKDSFDIYTTTMIEPNPFQKDGVYKRGFSLFAEDAVIKGISDRYHIDIVHYIDIGANHPYYGNASVLFYLNGATGCLVEPNSDHIELLREVRKNDKIINKGVSNKKNDGKKITYYMVKNVDTINTFSEKVAEKYKKNGFVVEENQIDVISLNTLIEEYGKKVNYISLDVEGTEFEILKDYDFKKYDVEIFNIEKGDERCCDLILSNGYEKVGETPSNWIFVKSGLVREKY